MPELLNCPFCGGTNIALLNGGLGNRFVHCDDCRATTDDGSEERAIAAWNRRSPPAVAAGGVTEARAIVDEMLARDKRNGFLTDWWRIKLDALDAALPAPPSRGEGE